MESWLLPLTIGAVVAAFPLALRFLRVGEDPSGRPSLETCLLEPVEEADRVLAAQLKLLQPEIRATVWRAAVLEWFTPHLLAATAGDLRFDGPLWRLARRRPEPGTTTRTQLSILQQLPFVHYLDKTRLTLFDEERRRLRHALWQKHPAVYRQICRRAGHFALHHQGDDDRQWTIAAIGYLLQGEDREAEELIQAVTLEWHEEGAWSALAALARTLLPMVEAGRIRGDGAGWIHFWQAQADRRHERHRTALEHLHAALEAQQHNRRLLGMTQQTLGELLTDSDTGEYQAARRHFCAARKTWRALGVPYGEAECLLGAADAARLEERFDVAERHLREASAIYEKLKAHGGAVLVERGRGDLALDTGRYADAESHYRRALDLCRFRNDDLGSGSLLQRLAYLAARQGDPDTARAAYHEAAEAFLRCDEERLSAACQMGSGHTMLDAESADLTAAQSDYEAALNLYTRAGDHPGRNEALYALGTVAFHAGEYDRALQHFRKARSLARRLEDGAAEIRCLVTMGQTAQRLHDHERAGRWLIRAFNLSLQEDNVSRQIESGLAAGRHLVIRHDYAGARPYVDHVLDLAHRANDAGAVAECHLLHGAICEGEERFDDAGRHYAAALRGFKQEQDTRRTGMCHLALGNLALLHDAYATAWDQMRAADACFAAEPSPWGRAAALRLRAELHLADGAFDAATAALDAARSEFMAIPDRSSAAVCRLKRAFGLLEQDRAAAAADQYRKALTTFEELEDPLGQADAHCGIGAALVLQGALAEARAAFERALPLYEQIGTRWGQMRCRRGLADVLRLEGKPADAVAGYRPILAYFRARGAREEIGRTLHVLGLALRTLDPAEAETALRESHTILSALDVPYAARVATDILQEKM